MHLAADSPMSETPVRFGPDERLIGILSSPPQAAPEAPACLLMNAGVIHRVGPHRVNVKLARALAAKGIASLRMDLSGLGDSGGATSGANFQDQAVADMRAAMDYLCREHRMDNFAVLGICSGAALAYRVALADERVTGCLMFDGFTYPTAKTSLVRRWKRFQRMSWPSVANSVISAILRPVLRHNGDDSRTLEVSTNNPTRAEFSAAMDTLLARGTAIWVMYSGSIIEYHNYHGQLKDAFRGAAFLPRIRYEFSPHIDHVITPVAVQREFVTRVSEWVAETAVR